MLPASHVSYAPAQPINTPTLVNARRVIDRSMGGCVDGWLRDLALMSFIRFVIVARTHQAPLNLHLRLSPSHRYTLAHIHTLTHIVWLHSQRQRYRRRQQRHQRRTWCRSRSSTSRPSAIARSCMTSSARCRTLSPRCVHVGVDSTPRHSTADTWRVTDVDPR